MKCFALLLTAATASLPLQAAEQPLWELGLGAGVLHLPHYRGADQSHTWVLPVPYGVYRGEIFKVDRSGARALLFESERFDLDFSASASAPTRSRDNDARRGMDDLDPTVEIGPNLNYTVSRGTNWKLDLRLPVRAAVEIDSSPRVIGWTASPNLNLDLARGPWNIGLQGGPLFGTRSFHGYFYDVGVQDATATRPSYRAGGGAAGWQATAALSRRFDDVWIGGYLRADSLSGASFSDSPLVRRDHTVSFGIAFSWVLSRSTRTVEVDLGTPANR